jgi:hypothetical protein
MATKGIKRRQKKSAVEAVGPPFAWGAYYKGLAAQHCFCGDGSESSGEIPYEGIFWGFVVLMSQRLLSTLLAPTSHTNPGTIPIAICYIVTAWTVLTNYTVRPKLGEFVNK